MSQVVLLRGVNVGGNRNFRPTELAGRLTHLGVVNIGAAGTFIVRQPVSARQLRAEFERHLPFAAEMAVCRGRDIVRLLSHEAVAELPERPDTVRFVSVLTRSPRTTPTLPVNFPASGKWLLRILARDGRYVFGVYRRHPKVIGYLGALDRLFGVPVTTRNWNTINAIVRKLQADGHEWLCNP